MFSHLRGLLIFVFLLGVPLPGCGSSGLKTAFLGADEAFQKWAGDHCELESDQLDLFLPPLDTHRVAQVGIDPEFTESERAAILDALEVWNEYGRRELGHDLYEGVSDTASTNELPGNKTSCEFDGLDGDGGFRIVKIDSYENWKKYELSDINPAVTVRCQNEGVLQKQLVLINTKLAVKIQIKSILVHELGHTIGLNHSCVVEDAEAKESSDQGRAVCNGLASGHPYRLAVMYPILRVRATEGPGSEQKESLQANDEARATCVHRMTERR